jgi:alkylation response protein AidB-like acyl-CoA dehydrogenase
MSRRTAAAPPSDLGQRTRHAGHADGLTALEHAVDIGIAATCAEGRGRDGQDAGHHRGLHEHAQAVWRGIASFQALRHRVADMKMQLELARSMSYYASLKLNAPADERRRAMARAKYQLGIVHARLSASSRCNCMAASA